MSSKLKTTVAIVMSFQVSTDLDLAFEHAARDMWSSATTYISRQTLGTYSLARFHVDTSSNVVTYVKRSEIGVYYAFPLLIYLDVILFRCMPG